MCVLRPQAIFLTVVVYITLLLFGRDSGAALQTDTEERLSTRWTFRASVETTHTEAGKDANPSSRSTFEYATSESKLAVWQTEALPDGRHTEELQRFPYADRCHTEPFFGKQICFRFSLPPANAQQNASSLWKQETLHDLGSLYEDVLIELLVGREWG